MIARFVVVIALSLFINLSASAARTNLFTGSNSHVNKLIQDHAGYIWIATDNGLTRFDGHNATTFTRTAESPSLLNNIVLSVMEDSSNNLWVGTYDGIQCFNRDTETFETPRLNYPGIPEFTYVNSIIEDSRKNIWFTTSRSGLICFTANDRKPICYLTSNSAICSDKTTEVFEDKFGNIWVGTYDNGITVFNPDNNIMTHHYHNPDDPTTLSGNMIYSIEQANDGQLLIASLDGGIDSYNYRTHEFTRKAIPVHGSTFVLKNDAERNTMYIGTDGNGIFRYDFDSKSLSALVPDVNDFDIRHSKVHDIIQDNRGNLWAALYQRGALMISDHDENIENFGYKPFNGERNIGNDPVLAIMCDNEKQLWIGTDGDGIYHTGKNGVFKHLHDNALESNIILCLHQDKKGDIWAGAYLGGLSRYNKTNDSFVPVNITFDGRRISEINTIAEDRSGRLWLGTNGNGICIYNPADGSASFLRYRNEGNPDRQICGNSIHTIYFDHNGNVWIGSSDAGLSKMRASDGKFEHFNLINRRLNNNCVYSVVEDRKGNIWVATAAGLACISDGKTTVYNERHGIAEAPVYGLLLDDDGKLWFSTSDSINCFNVFNKTLETHLSPERLGCREFKRGATFIDKNGRMYFGGVGGAVAFTPSNIGSAMELKKVDFQYLTFQKGDNHDFDSDKIVNISENTIVNLDYNSNTFSVGFSAYEFDNPDDVLYSVMLEKYNNSWQPITRGVQSATFSKIPAGKYTMRVMATLGESSVESSFQIIIHPPFYLSFTAKCLYVLLGICIIAVGIYLLRRRYSLKAERRRKAQEEALTEEKLQFFTDISHEVRTPLTLILSPITSLRKSTDDKRILETYDMMERNGDRILRMINQILDLRKFDNKRMRLQVAPTNIRVFLKSICDSFADIISSRNIAFTISVSDEVPEKTLLDTDKIDKVVFNVLANAIRYTPVGGDVSLNADIDGNGALRLRISDSGPGVPPESREIIFERFYQAKSEASRGGTGIGLHLSRKMMTAHHGSIFVENSSDSGATFAIIIPIADEAYSADEIASEERLFDNGRIRLKVENEEPQSRLSITKPHSILIVEDESAILEYLSETLSNEYNIFTARNGTEGLETAIRHRPHCIVTDLMMGGVGMDGLEMCRKIRSNNQICDIPVIMLTAKASDEQRIEGLEAGADSYITKPFNIEHLRTQISTLIHSRRVIRQKFTNAERINENVAALKSGDEKLLERVEAVVIKELSNTELSVEFIASEIGVSRSHLHRRLKELTNVSPSTYIKQTRMRHAAFLLTEKRMAVSEVAYATGFNSLSHFSTVFREFYGMSPTKFVLVNTVGDKSANLNDNF